MATQTGRVQVSTCKASGGSADILRLLLLRELNYNKVVVLRYALNCCNASVTSVLREMNEEHGISPSTLNAGTAIYVRGLASSIKTGIAFAERSIDSGHAREKLRLLRDLDGHAE